MSKALAAVLGLLPGKGWALVAAVVSLTTGALAVPSMVRARDARIRAEGERHGADVVRVDAALRVAASQAVIGAYQRALDTANARVAAHLTHATASAAKTKAVAGRVPAAVRESVPVVDTLVIESQALAATVTHLRADIMTQTTADSAVHRAFRETITAQAITIAQRDDRIRVVTEQRDRRVSRWAVAGIGAGVAAVSFVLGAVLGAP